MVNLNDEPSKLLRALDRERVVFVISPGPSIHSSMKFISRFDVVNPDNLINIATTSPKNRRPAPPFVKVVWSSEALNSSLTTICKPEDRFEMALGER